MPIEFINADLEIRSNEDLEPIKDALAEWGDRFFVIYCGVTDPGFYLASFEVHPDEGPDNQSAEVKILAFCDSLCELQGVTRELWDRATSRVIDLGYQADDHGAPFSDHFSIGVLRRLETLGIELALTIYPGKDKSTDEP